MVLKADLQKQVPGIKKKFIKYEDYAGKTVNDIFSKEELKGAVIKKVTNSNSSLLINSGNFNFSLKPLPLEAQFSPIQAIEITDFNKDSISDLLLTGNFFDVLPEIGRYDANQGLILQGKRNLQFEALKSDETGFFVKGQVRKSKIIKGFNGKTLVILAKNNDRLQVFSIEQYKR